MRVNWKRAYEQQRQLCVEWEQENKRLRRELLKAKDQSAANHRDVPVTDRTMSVLQAASVRYCREKNVTSVTPAELRREGYIG